MKQLKLLLVSFMVLTALSFNSVSALDATEVSIKTQEDFFAAFETQVEGRTYLIENDITFTKMNSKGTLTKDTFIKIPANSTIKGANEGVHLEFTLPDVQMTKVFSVLGDFTLENVSITAPHKTNGVAHQYTQTLFAFAAGARKINFTGVNLQASEKSVEVGDELHQNYGVALYFASKEAEVNFEFVDMLSGRMQFTKGSSGVFSSKVSRFSQERFRTLEASDELIIVDPSAEWEFKTEKNKLHLTYSFDNSIVFGDYNSYSYTEKLFQLVGDNFWTTNHTLQQLLHDDANKFKLEVDEGLIWDNTSITDIVKTILADEKYEDYKDIAYQVYTVGDAIIEEGQPTKPGTYNVNVAFTGARHGLQIPHSHLIQSFEVNVNETEKPVIKDPEVILDDALGKEFGTQKPSVSFTPGSFDEAVTMDLKKSALSDTIINSAVFKINEILKDTKVGRTFMIDISALNASNNTVQANEGARITVRFPLPESLKGAKELAVYYVSPSGEVTKLVSKVDADGFVSFETSHFSDFLVAELVTVDAEVPIVPEEPLVPGKPVSPVKPGVEIKKPVVDAKAPSLPATGVQSNTPILLAIISLGILVISVDQVSRYKKKIK